MPRQRTSPVYNFFEISSSGAKCKSCPTVLTFVTSANCEKHLKTHPEKWNEYLKLKSIDSELPETPKSSSRKRTIDPDQPALSFEPPRKKSLSSSEISRLDKAAILIGANPRLPLDILKIHEPLMRPGYSAPGKKKLRSMIVKFAGKILLELGKILAKSSAKCVSLDIWSDRSKSTYIGATIFTVNEDFEGNNYFLGLYEMANGTKKEQVRIGTTALLERVGLQMSDIDVFITDNGSNTIAGFKAESKDAYLSLKADCDENVDNSNDEENDQSDEELQSEVESEDESEGESEGGVKQSDFEDEDCQTELIDCQVILPRHFTCIDHSLELAIGTVIDKECKGTSVGTTLGKARKLVGSIRKSGQQKREIHRQTGFLPLLYGRTRWSSNFLMIDRLISVKGMFDAVNKAGAALISRSKRTIRTLNRTDIEVLEGLHSLIKPFHSAIMKLQQDKEFTSPLVYGESMELMDHTERFSSSISDL